MLINIYTATSIKTPAKKDGKIVYILEAVTETGKKAAVSGCDEVEQMNCNRAELLALVHALRRITKPEVPVHIYTDSGYVAGAIEQDLIEKWAARKWRNVKGGEIQNRELWEECRTMLQGRETEVFLNKANEYHNWAAWMSDRKEAK